MALKATRVSANDDDLAKQKKAEGNPKCDGLRHWYTLTGPKSELELYIGEVKTDTYNPVEADGTVTFSTIFPSMADECTLVRSRKPNAKTGKHSWNLNDSQFKILDGQLSRTSNTILQQKLIDAKFDKVMGFTPSASVVNNVANIEITLDTDDDKPVTKKAKVNPEADSE